MARRRTGIGNRLRRLTGRDDLPPAESRTVEVNGERFPTPTDEEYKAGTQLIDLQKQRNELELERHALAVEKENRALRKSIAIGALIVMAIQIVAANAIFVWYGDTNGWQIEATAISAWLGATVV